MWGCTFVGVLTPAECSAAWEAPGAATNVELIIIQPVLDLFWFAFVWFLIINTLLSERTIARHAVAEVEQRRSEDAGRGLEDMVVIYNRVPKTGSTSFTNAAYDLCGRNRFHVLHVNTTKNSPVMSLQDQVRTPTPQSHQKLGFMLPVFPGFVFVSSEWSPNPWPRAAPTEYRTYYLILKKYRILLTCVFDSLLMLVCSTKKVRKRWGQKRNCSFLLWHFQAFQFSADVFCVSGRIRTFRQEADLGWTEGSIRSDRWWRASGNFPN